MEGVGGERAWEGEERIWACGGEQRGEAWLAELYGEGGALPEDTGEEAAEQGGEEEEQLEEEEERLLTERSTGSSWVCVRLLGVGAKACMCVGW